MRKDRAFRNGVANSEIDPLRSFPIILEGTVNLRKLP
jgi:hypothetical protein